MTDRSREWKLYEGWGRFPKSQSRPIWLSTPTLDFPQKDESGARFVLPFGMGRSYGDSCLNDHHFILETRALNRYLAFDENTGWLKVQAGVTLDDVIRTFLPKGWFPTVVPGTKFVTIGGAIANDIHGKNHFHEGTFGCHVLRFELLRSDGRFICSAFENPELFAATIGGLGLTGLISWAEIRLRKVPSMFLSTETIRFESLSEYLSLALESEHAFEHTVSWIDCLAPRSARGRGLFTRGNWHSPHSSTALTQKLSRKPTLSFPIQAPNWLMGPSMVRAFNHLYLSKQKRRVQSKIQYFDPFFFPLDSIHNWNRAYGQRGFLQYQCVIPGAQTAIDAIGDILSRIEKANTGSFLAVLKSFGPRPSPGLLSFPIEGVTLALDFPNTGEPLYSLLADLDQITASARGRVYPAKDARMSQAIFSQYFGNFTHFREHIDPIFSSSFLRRVT